MRIDTTKLYGVRPIKIFNNCKVTDLDPLSTATTPRLIAVQMPDADGATMHAMWNGFPNLAVNDYVRCIRDTADTNILYVLGTGGATATSGGGAWPMPGVSIIGTTEYADLKTAIAAAAVGDEIRVGAGTDTSIDANQDLNDHHIVGSQSGSTIISVGATLTAALDLGAATYSDFEVLQTGNSASRLDTITLEDNVILRDVKVTGTNAGAGVCRTIYVADAGGFLINVHAEADEHAAYFDSSTGTTVVQGGYYKSSADYAIEVNSGTVLLAGPVLEGSSGALLITAGSAYGWFMDETGEIYEAIGSSSRVLPPPASETVAGIAELATQAETDTGTDDTRIITPLKLHSKQHDAVEVTHSANQSIGDNAWTALAFDTENEDSNGLHDTVTNNSRITAQVAGGYVFYASVIFAANSTGQRGAAFYKNGTRERVFVLDAVSAGGFGSSFGISSRIDMAATDYVECFVFQNSGGALNLLLQGSESPVFGAQWIGEK